MTRGAALEVIKDDASEMQAGWMNEIFMLRASADYE